MSKTVARQQIAGGRGCVRFTLENRSGYDTGDLARALCKAFAHNRIKTPKRVLVYPSPVRTRGCAEVQSDRRGARIVIAIASPSRFTMRRFARILDHECAHLRGVEHEEMCEVLLYSEGPAPAWSRGLRIRYKGRAPNRYS